MPAAVHVLCGPAGSGKTRRLLEEYQAQARTLIGSALWLGPTRRGLEALRLQFEGGGLLGPQFFTFQEFADEIVRAGEPAARPLSAIQRRLLIEQILGELHARRRLGHFAGVCDTQGFPDAVFALLTELKGNEIRPEVFARAVLGDAKHRQCARVYLRYQRRLKKHHLFDDEGQLWLARDLLARGQRAPFDRVQAVFVDGFHAFTPTQLDILEILCHQVQTLWFALPGEPGELRQALFQGARSTLGQLQARLQPRVEYLPAATTSRPAGLAHLQRQLFRPIRQVQQAADAHGLLRIEAPGLVGEVRMVARAIKELLWNGAWPADILVTLRDLGPYADLVREVFAEYGIPADIEGNEPLGRNPAVATLLRALRLPEEGWPFAAVTAVLRTSYFQPDWPETQELPEAAQHAEALLRLVGEARGKDIYLRAVERWADRPPQPLEDEQAEETRRLRTHKLAQQCRPFLVRFFAAWNDAPTRATLAEHAGWLWRLADDLGLRRAADGEPRDDAALERLWDELEQWARLEGRLAPERRRDRASFQRLLTSLAGGSGLARTARGPGRVRVLSAEAARHLEADHVFVMGLGERSFPRLTPPQVIFDDGERQALREAGIPLPDPAERLGDEMLLFYQVATRARKQLVLSYPAVDEQGQDLLPSSFFNAVLGCFADGALTVKRQAMRIEGFDRNAPLCPAEFRVRIAAACRGDGKILRAWLGADLAANLATAARIEQSRFHAQDFGPYDGLLRQPEMLAELRQCFGPEKVFSPTALETYIACPFKFYLKHVLRLEPLQEPREEIEGADRGLVFHRALSRLHRYLREAGINEPAEAVDAMLAERLNQAVDESVVRASAASEVLWRLEGQRLLRTAARYRGHWQKFLEPWRNCKVQPQPHAFEIAFGLPAAEGETPAAPLIIRVDGVEVHIGGRIDRVDVAALDEGLGFWIIDYKTGLARNYKSADLGSFQRLQLTLYALAVEEVLLAGQQARPLGLAYWLVTDSGPMIALPTRNKTAWLTETERWRALREQLCSWVVTLVGHLRQGTFPLKPRSENCTTTCDFSEVCRIGQSRTKVEGKSWQLELPQVR